MTHVPAGAIATGVTVNEPVGPAAVVAVVEPATVTTPVHAAGTSAVKTVLAFTEGWLTVTVCAAPAPKAVYVNVTAPVPVLSNVEPLVFSKMGV